VAAEDRRALGDLLPSDDEVARSRVRRMKTAATSALVVAAVVYVLTTVLTDGQGLSGYVSAAAEAAMVGGLADWFAVTALFRHPLGLPIPHTALIPRKKDELATKLGQFVTEHFLTADIVAEHLGEARVVERVGRQLADPAVAAAVAARVSITLADALRAVPTASVASYAVDVVRRDLGRRSYAPFLGRLLRAALQNDTQVPLVDIVARHAHLYLRDNRALVEHHLAEMARERGFRARLVLSDKRIGKLVDSLITQLREVDADEHHWLRTAFDNLLRSVAGDLEDDRGTARSVDEALSRLLDDPQLLDLMTSFLDDLLGAVTESLGDADSAVHERVAGVLQQLGQRAATDPAFQQAREDELRRIVLYAVANYGDTVIALIQRTVAGWEGRDASRRIETAVGRDLQFIRINGTIVGGLAGLVIHAGSVHL
jgi:uncharacterized membrane-anchored protein YjiN (DUF445 family)